MLTIYSIFENIPLEEAIAKFEGSQRYGDLKKCVAESVIKVLKPIQQKYHEIMNSTLLDEVLDSGRDRANAIANKKYETIRKLVGFGR